MLIEQLATAMDCEGYFGINKFRHPKWILKYAARIGLAMQHFVIPKALQDTFGGSLAIQPNPRGNFDMFRWSMVGNRSTGAVISALLPHLVVKQAQAQNLLDFLAYYYPANRWNTRSSEEMDAFEAFFLKAKALNRPAPATTERENPVTGCYSLNSQETVREVSEAKLPA